MFLLFFLKPAHLCAKSHTSYVFYFLKKSWLFWRTTHFRRIKTETFSHRLFRKHQQQKTGKPAPKPKTLDPLETSCWWNPGSKSRGRWLQTFCVSLPRSSAVYQTPEDFLFPPTFSPQRVPPTPPVSGTSLQFLSPDVTFPVTQQQPDHEEIITKTDRINK